MTALQAAQHPDETGLWVELRRAPLADARALDPRAVDPRTAIDRLPAED